MNHWSFEYPDLVLSQFSTLRRLLAIALVGFLARPALADVPAGKDPALLTEAQRTAAREFARTHHPQLNSLINRLKDRDPAEYERALTEVSKTQQRLDRFKDRDPERYVVDLALWRIDSRIRLLAARMASSEQASLEDQIRSLLNDRINLRLQQLALERGRLSSRMEKVDDQVTQLSADRDAQISKEIERLRKSVRNRAPATKRREKSKPSSERTPPQRPGKDSQESSPAPAPKTKS